MSKFGHLVFGAILAWFAVAAAPVFANQVTLSLEDGSFSVSGVLKAFDSEFFTIESEYGELTMAAATSRCEGAGCPDMTALVPKIHMAVSPELGDRLVPALIENFSSSRGFRLTARASDRGTILIDLATPTVAGTVATIEMSLMEATDGFEALAKDDVDMAVLRRAPTLSEKRTMAENNPSAVRSQVIGWETLRLYADAGNPFSALTVRQLMEKTGALDNEETAGQADTFGLDGDSDSLIALYQVMGHELSSPLQARSRDAQSDMILVTPNLSLPPPLKHIPVSASCGAPVQRDDDTFGAHPLEAPLYLYHANVRLPKVARDFMDYMLSVPAQRIVERSGFISRTPVEARMDTEQGILMNAVLNSSNDVGLSDLRRAVRDLSGFGRLSLTFRFREGTRDLDDVSRSNLGYLTELLQEGRFANRDVMFAGFSDSSGNALANLRLSLSRAENLRDTILAMMGENAPAPERFKAQGFGEVLPLACNDIAWGQHQNRRVEIWLR